MFELNGKYNSCKIFTDNCDNETIGQLVDLLNQKSVANTNIRIMPDTHAGKGCVIGTTMTLNDKVIPNLVGVDIGCGMYAIKLKEKEIDCEKLDDIIHNYVPSGFSVHENAIAESDIENIIAPINVDHAMKSLGTLGGGNHFIEVDRGSDGCLWLVIHTGSRHLGIEVCNYYQNLAYDKIWNNGLKEKSQALINQLKSEGRQAEIETELNNLRKEYDNIPKDLCYVEGEDFDNYIHDMKLAQEHAAINRETIASQIITRMGWTVDSAFQTIHNYIDVDNMILRKGSVSAQKGETLIIPMNMRDGSLICVGKGNPDWNYSAPHGAGRIMSRGKAKSEISMDDFKASMQGIYTTSVMQSTIDEAPMVYKPMQEIMENITDTVDIIDVIKPIYNFKASD
ncbi:RtcB family protein [bacterium]|nr:RtcB family protein [bacterium]